jgi:hypothetical protein
MVVAAVAVVTFSSPNLLDTDPKPGNYACLENFAKIQGDWALTE